MQISSFSKYIFWSYKPDADLPDQEVIKRVVSYGGIKDLIKLSELLPKKDILAVVNNWKEKEKFAKRINFMEKVILDA